MKLSKYFFEIIFELSNETDSISLVFFGRPLSKDFYLSLLFKVSGKAFQRIAERN